MPGIVATTLTGNCESIISDALTSVYDFVDAILLIDTGISDNTMQVARGIAGDKFRCASYEWRNDFAHARNYALQVAADHGFEWAMTVDTDERFVFVASAASIRRKLQSDQLVRAWLVQDRSYFYYKERIIRLPTTLRWWGRTHEYVAGIQPGDRACLQEVSFYEHPKSPEQVRAKLQRDLDLLLLETKAQPDHARWWYFLGQTHELLGNPSAAIDAFERCVQLNQWTEESAWACFCAARCCVRLRRLHDAIVYCGRGLGIQTGSPELAWFAGWCHFRLGNVREAIIWEELAVHLGCVRGIHAGGERVNFRHLPGWYEAPFNVLRFAYRRAGRLEDSRQAEIDFHAAREQRLRLHDTSAS